jgi:hypothetical protein
MHLICLLKSSPSLDLYSLKPSKHDGTAPHKTVLSFFPPISFSFCSLHPHSCSVRHRLTISAKSVFWICSTLADHCFVYPKRKTCDLFLLSTFFHIEFDMERQQNRQELTSHSNQAHDSGHVHQAQQVQDPPAAVATADGAHADPKSLWSAFYCELCTGNNVAGARKCEWCRESLIKSV